MTLTHSLAETKVQIIVDLWNTFMRVTLINTTWWQGKEYCDVNMLETHCFGFRVQICRLEASMHVNLGVSKREPAF